MSNLPTPILDYIHTIAVETLLPAYLLVKKDGCLSCWGGNLPEYGITNLQQGEYVTEQIVFLGGLLPLDNSPIFLPCMKMEYGRAADVHIFATGEGDWVLLLDASLQEHQRSLMQQKGNDLSLLRNKHSRILNEYLDNNVTENLAQEILALPQTGDKRDVTILIGKLSNFIEISEKYLPEIVLKALDLSLSTIIQPVLDEGGMVYKIIGDTVITIFGVLPTTGIPASQAYNSGLRMIEAVKEISQVSQTENGLRIDIGIAIASGSVILGIIGHKNSKMVTAVGYYVDLALELVSHVAPNQIIIDDNTFNKLDKFQKYFSADTLVKPPKFPAINTYSYLLKS